MPFRRHITRALVAVGVGVLVAAVASAITWGGKEDTRTPAERARGVLRDAAAWQRRGCDHRPEVSGYALGERFRREYATRLGTRCAVSPRVKDRPR
jgi:hypothetical protein